MKDTNHSHLSLFFSLITTILVSGGCSCIVFEDAPEAGSSACYNTTFYFSASGASSFSVNDSTDVFIYNDDLYARLDSYQKLLPLEGRIQASSNSGSKIAVLIQGQKWKGYRYPDVLSLEGLSALTPSIFDEDPSHPLRRAVIRFDAGVQASRSVKMIPLLSRIRIKQLKVDFSKTEYSDAVLEDARAYLINVSAICPILSDTVCTCLEPINFCGYDSLECSRMAHPEMLYSGKPFDSPSFWFYPAKHSYHPTRLVVEGKIKGSTYYYPISLPEDKMVSGTTCELSLTIRRPGSSNPDIPADNSAISAGMTLSEWNEYENEDIYI